MPTDNTLKVVLVNHSDIHGGAAVVTYRLLYALRRTGIDASMMVMTRYSNDPMVNIVSTRLKRGISFISERLKILMNNSFNRENLFKVSIANHGIGIADHPRIKEADIVVLSWINQGLVSIDDIYKLSKMGKKIIWIMHDMWCMTGICHHSLDCRNFHDTCGNCRFLGLDRAPNDLSNRTWRKKKDLYRNVPITFVAVSNWLKNMAKESLLLREARIEVIPNAFPIDTFPTEIAEQSRPFDMHPDKRYILFGAARIDDPIKGLDYAIDALNIIFDENPAIANTSEVLFFGALKNPDAFDNLRFPYRYVGLIRDPVLLRNMYAAGSVVLSTSFFETLPGTLIEGQAAGCVPVTFGRGGQSDIVTHLKTGFIAEYKNPESVARGIEWALRQPIDRNTLHDEVGRKFSSDSVTERYIKLFEELTGRTIEPIQPD